MVRDLYTTTDIKKTREHLINIQEGLCAVTKEKLVKPCLDHAHDSNCLVRGVLSHGINIFLGKIENSYKRNVSWWCNIPLPNLLRLLADYLEKPNYEANKYRHVKWIKRLEIDFNKLSEGSKRNLLSSLGQPEGSNGVERKKLFKKVLSSKQHGFVELQNLIKEVNQ